MISISGGTGSKASALEMTWPSCAKSRFLSLVCGSSRAVDKESTVAISRSVRRLSRVAVMLFRVLVFEDAAAHQDESLHE